MNEFSRKGAKTICVTLSYSATAPSCGCKKNFSFSYLSWGIRFLSDQIRPWCIEISANHYEGYLVKTKALTFVTELVFVTKCNIYDLNLMKLRGKKKKKQSGNILLPPAKKEEVNSESLGVVSKTKLYSKWPAFESSALLWGVCGQKTIAWRKNWTMWLWPLGPTMFLHTVCSVFCVLIYFASVLFVCWREPDLPLQFFHNAGRCLC